MVFFARFLGTFLLVAAVSHAADSFSKQLSSSDFIAAGLEKLTPAELTKLDQLFRARLEGATPQPTSKAAPLVAAIPPAQIPDNPPKNEPLKVDAEKSLPNRDKVLLTPGTEIEYSTLESTLAGPFKGWEKGTILTLENGQRWEVTAGRYATPTVNERLKVKIVPGVLGSFFMEIENGGRPRVRFVGSQTR